MDTIMVYPHPKTEKGISAYSINLIESLKEQGLIIKEETFISGKFFSLFKKIPNLLKYNIIHLQHEYNLLGLYGTPYFFLLNILGKIFRKKIIITMHTVLSQSQEFTGSKLKTFLRKLLYKKQNKCINKNSKLIIVHAQFFKDILVEEYNIPKEKIKVIPHGIIKNISQLDKEQAKKDLNLLGNVFLMIGGMIPDHGMDIVLKEADKIGKTILVVSNPFSTTNDRNSKKRKNYVRLCEEIVKKNRFEKEVRFDFKKIPNDLWWKYFNASDLVLLPYKGGIGSGIFADAMAVRKPVVASNIKYFKEISNKYGCIKTVESTQPFSHTINKVMNPKNYEKMIKECQRYFDENNLTVVAKKYMALYKEEENKK